MRFLRFVCPASRLGTTDYLFMYLAVRCKLCFNANAWHNSLCKNECTQMSVNGTLDGFKMYSVVLAHLMLNCDGDGGIIFIDNIDSK